MASDTPSLPVALRHPPLPDPDDLVSKASDVAGVRGGENLLHLPRAV
jgi:hypothetical protein